MGEPSRAKEETKKDGGDDGEDERARVIVDDWKRMTMRSMVTTGVKTTNAKTDDARSATTRS